MRCIPLLILGLLLVGCSTPNGASFDQRRAYVMKMHDDTLKEIYQRDPIVKQKIEQAPGHGVFSNIGTNLIFVSTEGGYGVAVDHATGKKSYMRMVGGGLGLGLGAKDTRLVLIFYSKAALESFMVGHWAVGADADAAAKVDDQGGEASGTVKTGDVEIYTLTQNGLALSATVGGTRFYLDRDLNGRDSLSPSTRPAEPKTHTVRTD